MSELSDIVRERLVGPNYWHLATLNADGTPQVSPVWVDLRDGKIIVNTATRHLKYRNMQRSPAVAISNMSTENPFDHCQVRGHVVECIEGDAAERDCDQMARKYTGEDYHFRAPDERRATFVIDIRRVSHFVP